MRWLGNKTVISAACRQSRNVKNNMDFRFFRGFFNLAQFSGYLLASHLDLPKRKRPLE
jgi:hypothetical protein